MLRQTRTIKSGGGPQRHPNWRPRGPRRFAFTYQDIADAAGRSVWAVKRAVYRGKLDPRDLSSVVEWVARRRSIRY